MTAVISPASAFASLICPELPDGWQTVRAGALGCWFGGGTPSKDNDSYWQGDVPWISPKDIKSDLITDAEDHISERAVRESATTMVPGKSLLMVVRSGILRHSLPVAINAVDVALNQDMKALVPGRAIDTRYLQFLIKGWQHVLLAMWRKAGATVDSLDFETVRATIFPIPPLATQSTIADFLDRKTRAIDELIRKKERLIELLQEKRQALITQAVTKGLDPNVPMKDSGVPWLGEVPADWNVKLLMHLTPSNRRIMYGIVLPGPDVEGGIPIVKGGDVKRERLKLESLSRTTPEIESRYVRSRLASGDLVFAIRGGVGDVEMVPPELEGANLTQDAARIAPASAVNAHWLLLFLSSHIAFSQIEPRILGATVRGINIRDLKRVVVPTPPPREQVRIAEVAGRQCRALANAQERLNTQIDRLREYRHTLISAAVTGQIDVSEEAGMELPGAQAG